MIRRATPLLLSLALFGAGCGSSGDEMGTGPSADADPVEVIDSWSSALREGDLERAAGYFRVPSVVQNGTPPVKLDSERKVVLFNASLPCGAELTKTEQRDDYVIATFELTERPGAGECGSGVGIEARTAFRIEDGLIVEWRRVADAPGSEPSPDRPVV